MSALLNPDFVTVQLFAQIQFNKNKFVARDDYSVCDINYDPLHPTRLIPKLNRNGFSQPCGAEVSKDSLSLVGHLLVVWGKSKQPERE